MALISIQTIGKELMLACRQLGHAISETLAVLVASTVVNAGLGSFYVERPIDEKDARVVVEEAAKRILSKEEPGIACLRLQAAYESSVAESDREVQTQRAAAKAAEEKAVTKIAGFTAKFDQDFDTLTILYKKIYQFLLLRCTGPVGSARPPNDAAAEREVAAALESVFPRVGLRSFVALTAPEKAAQLQELAGIVLGIRLFNQHQKKGGAGLPALNDVAEQLLSMELLDRVQKEADELSDLCKAYADAIVAAKNPTRGGPWDKLPTELEVDRDQSDLLYHRQYLSYLLNLQEDIASSAERLRRDQKSLNEELMDLEALIGGRVSVPKEQVYPRFDALARGYRTAWTEVSALELRVKLHGILSNLRGQYFPTLRPAAQELLAKVGDRSTPLLLADSAEDLVDLDSIPGPADEPDGGQAVRLTVENYENFLHVPLDFQGFCVHTLVMHDRLLVPGNPALGVVKYAGRYCVFVSERAMAEFCSEPDRFFAGVREASYRHPELIHLLRIHEDFPKSSLLAIIGSTAGVQAATQADVSTETPLHFEESRIEKNYQWNEWELRREALHMADIRRKATSATQTAQSHLRRENETQVYLPKEVATNTVRSRGTNPPRWRKYTVGLRGEPPPMQITEIKFDL